MLTRPLLTCVLVLSSGCSLALVKGPPDFIPAEVPMGSCTIERVLPVLDAVGAGAFVITAITSSDGNAVRAGAVLGGPVLDTALVQPLDGIASPLFGGPLIQDPIFTRSLSNRK